MPSAKRPTPKQTPPPVLATKTTCPTCGGAGKIEPLPRHNVGTQFADSLMDALGIKGENRIMYAVTLDAIDVRMSAYDRKFLTDLFAKAIKEKK